MLSPVSYLCMIAKNNFNNYQIFTNTIVTAKTKERVKAMKEQFGGFAEDYEDEGYMASATECTGLIPFKTGDEGETFAELYSEVYGFPAPRTDIGGKKKSERKR